MWNKLIKLIQKLNGKSGVRGRQRKEEGQATYKSSGVQEGIEGYNFLRSGMLNIS